MKILYGIQGTGNGHVNRARVMSRHLKNRNIDTTYLFSGRARESYFEMSAFGNFETRRGLTFSVKNGQVSYIKTLFENNPAVFFKEVKNLDLGSYDLVLCDFEPVTAWAGKRQKKPVISFGNQSAFQHKIPIENNNPVAGLIMKYFAPGNINIGLHWHHFGQPILPPIIDLDESCHIEPQKNKILVYLPFDDHTGFGSLFNQFRDYEFYCYHPGYKECTDKGNFHERPLSTQNFRNDFKSSASVICGAGFDLPSECIQFGKKLLVKPVKKQMEQASNAASLVYLGFAASIKELDVKMIQEWLSTPNVPRKAHYPDVGKALVNWIAAGEWQDYSKLQNELWEAAAI